MGSPRGTLAGSGALLAWLGLAACGIGPLGAAPRDANQVVSRAADVPADLHACPASGSIDTYMRSLQRSSDGDTYRSVADAWTQLKKEGAAGAAVAVFASTPATCQARLGAGAGRSLANLVAVFPDDRAAAAAYRQGIFGFPTPPAEAQLPGVSTGVSTGLTDNAWVVSRDVGGRALYVAWWQDGAVASFLVTTDLDTSESTRAAQAVERRVR